MSKNEHRHANPEMAKALRELRRSGAAGKHADSRSQRARTRSANLNREISEQVANGDWEDTKYGELPDNRYLDNTSTQSS